MIASFVTGNRCHVNIVFINYINQYIVCGKLYLLFPFLCLNHSIKIVVIFSLTIAINQIVWRKNGIIVFLKLVTQFGMIIQCFFCFAAASDDYDLLQYLYFNNTDIQKCYNISIVQDDICEIDFINNISNKILYSILSTYASRVNIEQPRANVSIDDDQEPECGR